MTQSRCSWIKVLSHLKKILNGIFNFLFGSRIRGRESYFTKFVELRENICINCTYYDEDGTHENTVIKGKPACSICGCNIKLLTNCTDCVCSKEDIGEKPLW